MGNVFIHFRVSRSQHVRIKNDAQARGYRTVSAYIRALTLEHNLQFENKFNHLYNSLVEDNIENEVKDKPLTAFL